MQNISILNLLKKFWPFALLILIFLIHWRHDLDADEGLILAGAWNIFNNQKLYIDFFSYKMPGNFYVIAWLFKIFGAHYYVANFFAIILLFFNAIGIYKIGRFFLKKNLALLPAFLFVLSSSYWPLINHNFFNIFFITWSIYFLLSGIQKQQYYSFVFSGLCAGTSMLFLQHRGLAFFMAAASLLAINYIKNRKPRALKKILIFIASALLPLSLLIIFWPINLLYNNLIIFPLFHYGGANQISRCLFFFFIAIWLIIYFQIKKEKNNALFALWYIQIFLLISAYPRPGKFHLYLIIFPLYILISLIIQNLAANKGHKTDKILIFSFSVLLALYIASGSFLFLYFSSPSAEQITQMINKDCRESKYIYAGPFMPGIYFESKKLNPSPYPSLITGLHTEEQFSQAKQALIKYQPECAVVNYWIVKKYKYNTNNPVDNYIKNNYTLIDSRGTTELYKRSVK